MELRERVVETILNAIWGPLDDYGPEQIDEAYRITDLVLASITKTDDGAPAPAEGSSPLTPGATSTAAPSSPYPRLFVLYRHVDLSNVSGTGVVAEGVVWSDGRVSLHWPGPYPSTVAWDNTEGVIAIHGHSGATELRWIDHDLPIDLWPTEGTAP